MAMTLLFREMFSTTGTLTSASPGSNFSAVTGTMYMQAGGPRLSAGTAASFDPQTFGQNTAYTSFGETTATNNQTKVVIGAWFFIKNVTTQGANASPILSFRSGTTSGNRPIGIYAEAGNITTYFRFGGGGVNQGNCPVTSGWVYLAIAISKVSGTNWDGRMYYKTPGGALTQFVSWTNENSFFSNWGSALFGCVGNNPSFNGRMGACSVYSFANSDFSDVIYPSDLIDPTTGLSWYVNSTTGNDANDGVSPESPWLTQARINTATANSGFLAASSYAAGDTLYIDTSGGPLDQLGQKLLFQTNGLNVRAASGQTWISLKSWEVISSGSWSTTGTANVYSTTDTVATACLWEDDKWLNHPLGANFAAVSASLGSTPGSFWTNGTTLYLHPFGSTDPRSDGKSYTRSDVGPLRGASVEVKGNNVNIQDLYIRKTCDVDPYTNGYPNGGYGIGFIPNGTNNLLKHCYSDYNGKHGISLVANLQNNDVLTIDTCQVEQGSPYGSQTPYVSFTSSGSFTGVAHYYVNCVCLKDTGLIGSTAGSTGGEVFYTHNSGGADQFSIMSFDGCNFAYGYFGGTNAVVTLIINNTIFGGDSQMGARYKTITRSKWLNKTPNQNRADGVLTVRNCIIAPTFASGLTDTSGSMIGTVVIENNTFDCRNVISNGGYPRPGMLSRTGAVDLTFRNNVVWFSPAGSGNSQVSLFQNFVNTDTLAITKNVVLLNGQTWSRSYNDGSTTADRTFAQWQTLGFDAGSISTTDLMLQSTYIPKAGSPVINAGTDIGPVIDYSGVTYAVRKTIGAYEGNNILLSGFYF